MDELIEELWDKYSIEEKQYDHFGFADVSNSIYENDFKQAIQTACKAQANACVRDFNNYAQRHEYSNNCARVILIAKIERQDYE